MRKKLKNLLNINRLQDLIDHIYASSDIPTGIIERNGDVVASSGLNKLCEQYHKNNEITNGFCQECFMDVEKNLESGSKFYLSKCKNGMIDISVPILIDGSYVATLFQGQFFDKEPDISEYNDISDTYDFSKEEYLEAVKNTEICCEEKIQTVIDFLTGISQFISDVASSKYELEVRNLELLRKNEELEDTFFDLISVEDELKERLEELKEKSRKLEEMSDRYRLISEGTHDVIWDINIANNDLFVSDKMSNILDGDVELSSYKEFSNFLHHDDKEKVISKFRDRIKSGQYYEDEFRLVTKKGDVKHLLCRGKVLRDEDNKPIKMAGSIKNITEKRLYEEKIEELAYTDMLTGLKNRNKCTLDIDKNLNEVRGKFKKNLSVMYIDIDDFKNVNDIYGHPLGDYILKKVSKRLEKLMDEGMELYRFGGDEFLIRMTDYEDIDSVRKKASEILDKISKPFRVNKKEFFLTLSIGIAESKNGKTKFHKMLKKADMALNKAKEEGKNKFWIFTNKLQEESFTNISIESDLKKAISNDELFLVFQPKINIKDNYVDGFEALIRWKHPEKGIVYPGEFIDIAEKSGTIKLIDEWVFKNIIIKTNELEKSGVSFDSISFNVSPSTLLHYSTIENIKAILKENNFKPNKIKIEITENAMIDSINNAKDILNVLKELGFAISLDDFGKGYSSLNYLKMLPIDELKIDKAFIDDIDYSDKDIIDLIINLGHRMGLKIIAEGVENYSQYKYLKDNKCDVIQGYYLAKPLEFDEINLFCEVFH